MLNSVTAYKKNGFTLLELMIVIAIFTMVMAVGGPSFSRMIERNQLQAASSDLTMSILWARSEAIKRNARVRMSSSASGVSFEVFSNPGGPSTQLKEGRLDFEPGIFQIGPSFVDFMPNGRVDISGTPRQFELTKIDGKESKRCVYISAGGIAKAMTDKNDDGNCANG